MRRLLAALLLTLLSPTAGRTDELVELTARPGQAFRMLVERPPGRPAGSLILLPGGDGDVRLGPDGRPTRLNGNQLVRTRLLYAQAGWAVALPEPAPDIRAAAGARGRERVSEAHVADLGAAVVAMRRIARPVVLVGTSRGSLPAAAAAAGLSGAAAPDAVVLTAGMLMDEGVRDQPSVQRDVPGLLAWRGRLLLLHHARDACRITPPSGPARLRALMPPRAAVEVLVLDGGIAEGPPCEARHFHGFNGMDEVVVAAVLRFAAGR
jgi:hypothetical protein